MDERLAGPTRQAHTMGAEGRSAGTVSTAVPSSTCAACCGQCNNRRNIFKVSLVTGASSSIRSEAAGRDTFPANSALERSRDSRLQFDLTRFVVKESTQKSIDCVSFQCPQKKASHSSQSGHLTVTRQLPISLAIENTLHLCVVEKNAHEGQ